MAGDLSNNEGEGPGLELYESWRRNFLLLVQRKEETRVFRPLIPKYRPQQILSNSVEITEHYPAAAAAFEAFESQADHSWATGNRVELSPYVYPIY